MASEQTQPRICTIMGVQVGERFKVADTDNRTYRISMSGNLHTLDYDGKWRRTSLAADLIDAINHPEKVIRKHRWTKEDVGAAKALRKLDPYAVSIQREYEASPIMRVVVKSIAHIGLQGNDTDTWETELRTNAFRSLEYGESAELNEIIRSGNNEQE